MDVPAPEQGSRRIPPSFIPKTALTTTIKARGLLLPCGPIENNSYVRTAAGQNRVPNPTSRKGYRPSDCPYTWDPPVQNDSTPFRPAVFVVPTDYISDGGIGSNRFNMDSDRDSGALRHAPT